MDIRYIDVNLIVANADQPRKHFDDEKLAELAISIAQYGVLQPIIVSDNDDGTFKIIAGERRFRASKMAKLKEVPVVVSDVNRYTADKISIIENVQRDDLSAIEEALAYKKLIETYDLSQTEIGKLIGKKPSTVSNKLRLLKLSEPVRNAISANQITERHGRAMINLAEDEQHKYLEKIISNSMTVSGLEKELNKEKVSKNKNNKRVKNITNSNYKLAVNTIKQAVAMIENTGLSVVVEEEEIDDELIMKLRISRG